MNELEKIWEELLKPEKSEEKKVEEPAIEEPVIEEPVAEEKPTEEKSVEKPVEEEKPEEKPIVEEKEEFDVSEEKGKGKLVYVIYGHKGEGKTYLALTFPGKIAVLSFDHKATPVKSLLNLKDDAVKVWDAIRYEDASTAEKYLESNEKTFRYINYLLDTAIKQFKPDWIVIDGAEIFERVCEMTMRFRNGLQPFEGIANRNLWKERRLYIRQVHNKMIGIAKQGVIYTTYVDKDEVVKEGELVAKEDVPRWIDAILYETDIVLRVRSVQEKGGVRKFFATVESSKYPPLKTGIEKDITGTGYKGLKE